MALDIFEFHDCVREITRNMAGKVSYLPAQAAFAFEVEGLRFEIERNGTRARVTGRNLIATVTAEEMRAVFAASQRVRKVLVPITNMHGATYWGTEEEAADMRHDANSYQREFGRAWNE